MDQNATQWWNTPATQISGRSGTSLQIKTDFSRDSKLSTWNEEVRVIKLGRGGGDQSGGAERKLTGSNGRVMTPSGAPSPAQHFTLYCTHPVMDQTGLVRSGATNPTSTCVPMCSEQATGHLMVMFYWHRCCRIGLAGRSASPESVLTPGGPYRTMGRGPGGSGDLWKGDMQDRGCSFVSARRVQ